MFLLLLVKHKIGSKRVRFKLFEQLSGLLTAIFIIHASWLGREIIVDSGVVVNFQVKAMVKKIARLL